MGNMGMPRRSSVFVVDCRSQERRQQAEQLAREGIDLGKDYARTTRAFPNGVEKKTVTHHRLRDYFAEIRIEKQPQDTAFRLVFSPREGADRYWKDLMVQILASISAEGVSVKSVLKQRGGFQCIVQQTTTLSDDERRAAIADATPSDDDLELAASLPPADWYNEDWSK